MLSDLPAAKNQLKPQDVASSSGDSERDGVDELSVVFPLFAYSWNHKTG